MLTGASISKLGSFFSFLVFTTKLPRLILKEVVVVVVGSGVVVGPGVVVVAGHIISNTVFPVLVGFNSI